MLRILHTTCQVRVQIVSDSVFEIYVPRGFINIKQNEQHRGHLANHSHRIYNSVPKLVPQSVNPTDTVAW